ncbi:hypothetical protein PSHT_14480 [Puccinia striiformis]|uniref:Uncharacterized protein n=1 Tax=Puccinia striiformis TaxID=27350 RepID=A0A2S4UK66_9BASI|nr:hypothetical protein PSHT_14480 [Puccinia striiformis]
MLLNSFCPKICTLRSPSAPVSSTRLIYLTSSELLGTLEKRSRRCATPPSRRFNQTEKFTTSAETNSQNVCVEHVNTKRGNRYNLLGRLYEEHSLKCMQKILLMKDLVHVGKRGSQDGGIDVRGWLYSNYSTETQVRAPDDQEMQAQTFQEKQRTLPWKTEERFIRAIAQCKCSRVDLKLVRELEGLVASGPTYTNPSDSKPTGTIGLLFAARGFTSASLTRAERSPIPLILVTLDLPSTLLSSPDNDHQCKISHCYPNPTAVRLIHPFKFIRVSKLTSDGLPAEQSWILVDQTINNHSPVR